MAKLETVIVERDGKFDLDIGSIAIPTVKKGMTRDKAEKRKIGYDRSFAAFTLGESTYTAATYKMTLPFKGSHELWFDTAASESQNKVTADIILAHLQKSESELEEEST